MLVFISGNLLQVDIAKKVKDLGGTLVDKASRDTFCCLSSPGESEIDW